jgi:D-amino-acid dehydrogenase
MRVAVIGAGIIGTTTAHELAVDGHEVTVFERRGGVAAEASFANAGLVAPGYVTPWAAPGMPGKIARYLFSRHAPVRWKPSFDAAQWNWILRWLKACKPEVYQRNRADLYALAQYSRARLHSLTQSLRLDYERSQGYLVLLRNDEDRALAEPGLAMLRELGVSFRELDAQQCRTVEPALNASQALQGGIHLPQDEVGNCRQFAHLLRDAAERRGVEFRFATEVSTIGTEQGRPMLRVEQHALTTGFAASRGAVPTTGPGGLEHKRNRHESLKRRSQAAARYLDPVSDERFDAVVVCAGVASVRLLPQLGLHVPLLPVYGYSLTVPLRAPERGPRSALMDERYKIAISRLGQRVRVAGSAEIGGHPERHSQAAIATLYKVLDDWFPGAGHLARPQLWKGARPMLPDGPPLIGPSGQPGVWLNLGHGSSGWALSCGSARLLADLLGNRAPAVDVRGFSAERYRHRS